MRPRVMDMSIDIDSDAASEGESSAGCDVSGSEGGLYERFFTLQMLLRAYRFHAHHKGGVLTDVSRGQGRILALLKLKDGMRARELARLMGIRVSSLNEALSKLEDKGYITRTPYEKDKRVVLISLTEKGRAAKQQGNGAPSLFANFTDEEKQELCEYLDRMVTNLEEQSGTKATAVLERERKRREVLFSRLQDEPDERRERARRALFPAL